MLGLISKAISSIPKFTSKTKITTPTDPQLQQKLNSISSQILKTQSHDQFKVYQQLQSTENADFNRNLRKIYQHEECTTETINAIIRFYTFLLTNCKNELVVCKLVSEPLVIELTKIVLQVEGIKEDLMEENIVSGQLIKNSQQDSNIKQEQPHELGQSAYQQNNQPQSDTTSQQNTSPLNSKQPTTTSLSNPLSTSLHYLHDIDWDQVNAYKIALIRSYINCINPETIKYMIIDNQLPIFVNCVNGYKHYLTEGVEGTCLSNCILMILTKVNHNDEVCEIIFDEEHHSKASQNGQYEIMDLGREKLSKSISNQKSIKLHIFVKQVIKKISVELSRVLQKLHEQLQNCGNNLAQKTLKQFRKLEGGMEFIESNILFCVDLINSINNYNYTTKIKNNIGEAIESQLIGKIIGYVCEESFIDKQSLKAKDLMDQISEVEEKDQQNSNSTPFQLITVKLIKFVLNLSITCQKESMMIQFLNRNSPRILQTLIDLNESLFNINQEHENQQLTQESSPTSQVFSKECISYTCDFALVLLKQTISPYSRLASRKRLEISQEVLELKENLLSKIFVLLEQLTKSEQLKENICYKTIRNLLLCVFYLTIKEDKCALSSSNLQISQTKSPGNSQSSLSQKPNLGLILQFKYSILLLHKIFSQQFKKVFADNKNWQFIVNNYQGLMRQVPNSILSPEESDKHCHYHNGHNYSEEDKTRDTIMICEAVRNYRYMIIHETKLEDRLIRLENIYHKHFMSPGWEHSPGQTIQFVPGDDCRVVCVGLLHNNSQQKLPIQIIQDFECLLIGHKLSQQTYKLIANIRYKKIQSFVPEPKNFIRIKLIGIQELILEFSSPKILSLFKEYLNENRNKTRQKQLKFINYYLNMYLKDTSKLIQEIYNQDLVGLQTESDDFNKTDLKLQNDQQSPNKKFSFDNIEIQSFSMIEKDQIPEHSKEHTQSPNKHDQQEQNTVQKNIIQEEMKPDDPVQTQETINQTKDQI